MKFLKTLLWVVILAFAVILAVRNWRDVTINLWGDLQMDVKIPILLLMMVLLGFLPTWLVHRARAWRGGRREAVPGPTPLPAADHREERE